MITRYRRARIGWTDHTRPSTVRGIRVLGAAVAVVSAALAVAHPAFAEPSPGPYTATMVDAGASNKKVGSSTDAALTPCGAGCVHLAFGDQSIADLHQAGGLWTGKKDDCKYNLHDDSLLFAMQCASDPPVLIQLTKNG